jgi:hypothetical protein
MKNSLLEHLQILINSIQKLSLSCYPSHSFKIGYITFFAKDEEDFRNLISELESIGTKQDANNGYKFILNEQLIVEGEVIEVIRVRKPDIHRKELGCADLIYNEDDYKQLREEAIEKGFDVIVRKGYEMIELSTFDINAYAYIVKDL